VGNLVRVPAGGWRGLAARIDPVVVGLVIAVAAVAFVTHAAYRHDLRLRWASLYHDRNAHYQAGLGIAAELRQGHLVRAALDLDAASLGWPVLHPFCLAAVHTVAGLTPEVAVIPSLLGWCAAAVFAFLIARRLGGAFGRAGGLVAAAFVLGSPALQALGTDVMLEGLGLGLTLAVVHAYLVFARKPTRPAGAVLGGLLSLLFLQKYNYWGIAVVSLGLVEVLPRLRHVVAVAGAVVRVVPWGDWVRGQFRRPLNYAIAALLGVSLAARLNGGVSVEWGGVRFGFKETRLLVNAAYGLFLVRLAGWWWPTGRAAVARLCGEPWVALLTWALIPVQLWLLLPFRLHYFLWYAGPGNNPGVVRHTPLEGFRFYLGGFVNDYHVSGVLAAVAAGFAVLGLVGLTARRSSPPGWLAVPAVFFVCGTLTILHPNQQMRFLTSWAPLLWITAGVGVATLLRALARVAGPTAGRVAGVTGVAALAGVLVYLTPALARPSMAIGRGYGVPDVSLRDLYEAYLPLIDGTEPTAIFANTPEAAWRWPFLERFGHKTGLKTNMRDAGAFDPVTAEGAAKWLQNTAVKTVVYVEIPPTSPLFEPSGVPADNAAIKAVMLGQRAFRLEHRVRVRDLGTVYVWKR
jgi:hypothetical protein